MIIRCDIGIPGSGTCSNCKKSNHRCVFSPVSSSLKQEQRTVLSQLSDNGIPEPSSSSGVGGINRSDPTNMYQIKNPFFSIDERGHCSYEKHGYTMCNDMTFASSLYETPPSSKQLEQELFDVYFTFVHPFYPIMDRFYISQALQFDTNSLPAFLKWAIMAVALHFTHKRQDSIAMAACYYDHASLQLDHTPSLLSLQALFLLYKYQELNTPVGAPLSVAASGFLKDIQVMIHQLKQQRWDFSIWTISDEFLNRADWILYIVISLSSTADERWKALFEQSTVPACRPSLTDSEQYDKDELGITCNLIHLINISLLYSKTLCLISDQGTLFVSAGHPEFIQLAADFDVCKSRLPSHIALSLTAEPAIRYSAQNHTVAGVLFDSSKTTSFTAYICLIYDILDLLIYIHQCSSSTSFSYAAHITKKVYQIYYRVYSFTTSDNQDPHFPRMASIQGNRIVSFSLTLALQAHSYCLQQTTTKSLEDLKRYYACWMRSFQIFDDMALSPALYMTIQNLRAQTETKQQLNFTATPESTASYFDTTIQQRKIFDNASQQYHPPHLQEENEHEQWQGHHYQCYEPENRDLWNQHGTQGNLWKNREQDSHDECYNMPSTPTFVQELDMSPPLPLDLDPITPPSFPDIDGSYFQSQSSLSRPLRPEHRRFVPVVIATAEPSSFSNHFP